MPKNIMLVIASGMFKALQEAGLRDRVKVIIGGSPVSEKFAQDIQADACASTAPQGVDVVKAWMV